MTTTATYPSGGDFVEGALSPCILGHVNQALAEASLLISKRSISSAIAAE